MMIIETFNILSLISKVANSFLGLSSNSIISKSDLEVDNLIRLRSVGDKEKKATCPAENSADINSKIMIITTFIRLLNENAPSSNVK